MKITWLGHSGFMLESADTKIVFDPFITPIPAFGAAGIKASDLMPDYVLLSHGHQDHMYDVETIVKQSKATLIGVFELIEYYKKLGVEDGLGMNIGGKVNLPFGSIRLTQAIHSSSFPDGSYAGSASGFVVNIEGKTLYYSGDTCLFGDMKLIAQLDKPSIAFLPIGNFYTMGVDEALIAATYAGVKTVIGMHYDTFPGIAINHEDAFAKAAAAGIKLILPVLNQPFEV